MTHRINAVEANSFNAVSQFRMIKRMRVALLLCGYTLFSSLAHAQEGEDESDGNSWEVNATTQAVDESDKTSVPSIDKSDSNEIQINQSEINALSNKSSGEPATLSREEFLEAYDISKGASPIVSPIINTKPRIDISDEQRQSLESQFAQIQLLKETEDAFSEQLGESYLSYGRILMQVGQTDEARKMLVNALHLAKINNGVNAIEQRPILRELFELNFALGNADDAEENLRQIVWLEKKIANNKDFYSYDLFARLGTFYLDLYISDPVINQLSLDRLHKATRYLSYTLNRYGDQPLSQVLLPYGELAHAHHLKDRIQGQVDRSFYESTRQRTLSDLNRRTVRRGARVSSFARSEGYLKDYLRKAKNEQDLVNAVKALLGLGDLNLLNDRVSNAQYYYDLAWMGAQNLPLDHPIVVSFDSPVKLPAFAPAVIRQGIEPRRAKEIIPMSVSIGANGQVKRVAKDALIEVSTSKTNRARRIARRAVFRPVIENGKLLAVDDHALDVSIIATPTKAKD